MKVKDYEKTGAFIFAETFRGYNAWRQYLCARWASKSLLAHELIHVEQQKRNPIMFYFWYLFDENKRLDYEAEAYAASVRAGLRIDIAAMNLAFDYKIKITVAEAKERIGYL